jgi:8-oxo-dGTP pyrophosphatase MutT (NUDIX family)
MTAGPKGDRLDSIDDLPERVARQLSLPLPGRRAQRIMEPELGFGRHFGPARPDARPAAVVALLHRRGRQWQLPLMLRGESLPHHAGQIGLPGGAVDPDETTEDAAMRELEEELGVDRFAGLLLGQLSPVYLFGTNFLISPWVAAVRDEVHFQPNAAEVELVLEVPAAHLLDETNRGRHIEQRGLVRLEAPHFVWGDHRIWGGTALILAELAAVLAVAVAER